MRVDRVESLLDVDPDLGQLLPLARAGHAARDLLVRLQGVPRGPWDVGAGPGVGPEHFGLLVAEGVIVREVVIADTVSAELLGPGDVLRPWQQDPSRLLRAEHRFVVLEPTVVAMLDRRFTVAVSAYPEVVAMLADRMMQRTRRLAAEKAIAQLNGVDRRMLALLWSLAERWGRVTRDGVVVPLDLPHRVLAQLIGARRPTVSTAMARLARSGTVLRRSDGTWLLTGDPVGEPVAASTRPIKHRRFSPGRTSRYGVPSPG